MRYDERGCGLSGPDDVTAGLVAGPEVQTQVEQGLPTVPVTFWWGLVRPAGMPPSIVARLNTEVAAILATLVAHQETERSAQIVNRNERDASNWKWVGRWERMHR